MCKESYIDHWFELELVRFENGMLKPSCSILLSKILEYFGKYSSILGWNTLVICEILKYSGIEELLEYFMNYSSILGSLTHIFIKLKNYSSMEATTRVFLLKCEENTIFNLTTSI